MDGKNDWVLQEYVLGPLWIDIPRRNLESAYVVNDKVD